MGRERVHPGARITSRRRRHDVGGDAGKAIGNPARLRAPVDAGAPAVETDETQRAWPVEAREIGDLMAFLASDRSGYTSGVIFTVDGGHTSGWS